jgi:hypothetical protein
MAAKKTASAKADMPVETLTKLEYDQYVEVLAQFDRAYPAVGKQKEFLGISLTIEAGLMAIKITVTQLGEARFTEAMDLPKDFEATCPGARAPLKVWIKSAPILTSAAPKSAAGKKTAPVFPVKGA